LKSERNRFFPLLSSIPIPHRLSHILSQSQTFNATAIFAYVAKIGLLHVL
jgi:hypothetical protein